MKPIRKPAFLILTGLILSSCSSVLTFTEPQPAGVKPIPSFPARYRGNYIDTKESCYYHITASTIARTSFYRYDFPIDSTDDAMLLLREFLNGDEVVIDSSMLFVKKMILDAPNGTALKVRKDSDTIRLTASTTDTLFSLSDMDVVKRYHGSLWLNQQKEDSTWETAQVRVFRGNLVYSEISNKNAIETVQLITGSNPADSLTVFSPTKKQFRAMVKAEVFTLEKQARKIKDPCFMLP